MSRRHAFVAMAAGAAAVTAIPAQAAEVASSLDSALSAARAAAIRASSQQIRRDASPVREARVLLCRSWDRSVYLYVDGKTRGFVALDEAGLALASACQAADRPVAVRYWGYDSAYASVGRFDGALLAIDPRDLAPQSGVEAV